MYVTCKETFCASSGILNPILSKYFVSVMISVNRSSKLTSILNPLCNATISSICVSNEKSTTQYYSTLWIFTERSLTKRVGVLSRRRVYMLCACINSSIFEKTDGQKSASTVMESDSPVSRIKFAHFTLANKSWFPN